MKPGHQTHVLGRTTGSPGNAKIGQPARSPLFYHKRPPARRQKLQTRTRTHPPASGTNTHHHNPTNPSPRVAVKIEFGLSIAHRVPKEDRPAAPNVLLMENHAFLLTAPTALIGRPRGGPLRPVKPPRTAPAAPFPDRFSRLKRMVALAPPIDATRTPHHRSHRTCSHHAYFSNMPRPQSRTYSIAGRHRGPPSQALGIRLTGHQIGFRPPGDMAPQTPPSFRSPESVYHDSPSSRNGHIRQPEGTKNTRPNHTSKSKPGDDRNTRPAGPRCRPFPRPAPTLTIAHLSLSQQQKTLFNRKTAPVRPLPQADSTEQDVKIGRPQTREVNRDRNSGQPFHTKSTSGGPPNNYRHTDHDVTGKREGATRSGRPTSIPLTRPEAAKCNTLRKTTVHNPDPIRPAHAQNRFLDSTRSHHNWLPPPTH